MKNKKIGVVITDGVGVRNFLFSNFIVEACKEFSQVIIYSGVLIKSLGLDKFPKNVKVIELPVYKESKLVWFFRKLKEVAHMYKHKNFYGINDNYKRGYPKNNTPKALVIKLIYAITKIGYSEKWIKFYEKKQFNAFKNNILIKKIKLL